MVFLSGCSDDAIVTHYNKEITEKKIPCMRLVVFPPNKETQKVLESLYNFKNECNFALYIAQKSGIVCNSTQNVEKKVLSSFPSSYLKISLKKRNSLIYSYYIDLKESVNQESLKKAFSRLKSDLIID
jgi:hypothetical protein